MGRLVDNMQWVLLVCGLLTLSMLQAVFTPRTVMLLGDAKKKTEEIVKSL